MVMDKERIFEVGGGYSEEQEDQVVDKQKNDDQVKAGNIFVAPLKNKKIIKSK